MTVAIGDEPAGDRLVKGAEAIAWSQITDHVTYLSVRPDPGRVLPGGYVHPLLLKNQPAAKH